MCSVAGFQQLPLVIGISAGVGTLLITVIVVCLLLHVRRVRRRSQPKKWVRILVFVFLFAFFLIIFLVILYDYMAHKKPVKRTVSSILNKHHLHLHGNIEILCCVCRVYVRACVFVCVRACTCVSVGVRVGVYVYMCVSACIYYRARKIESANPIEIYIPYQLRRSLILHRVEKFKLSLN